MPKTVADFLKDLVTKASVKLDDEANKAIKDALATPELANIQVPDELVTGIDNGLLSLDAAKNSHPAIKGHYFAMAYDGLDKELSKFIEDHKVPDDIKAEILAERSSTKKAILLAEKIKTLTEKQASAGKGEKDQLQTQINDLHNQLRKEKDSINGIKAEYEKKLRDKDMSYALRNLLSGYKTIWDEMNPTIKDTTLKAVIDNSLSVDEAEFTISDSGQLVLQKKDGSNFFGDNHQQLTPKAYLDKVLSREKILKVNDPPAQPAQGARKPSYTPSQNQNGNGEGKKVNHTLIDLNAEALAALESPNGQQ